MAKKSTKRSLILSALSLLMCVSMLVGTTFAWFTDSVTSVNNKIVAGNLDVELYWSTDATNWTAVNADTNIFKEGTLWEPGHTEVVYLKVVNEGTLALKYQFGVNIAAETAGTNVADEAFLLSDYIYFSAINDVSAAYADRAEARAAAAAADAKIISEGFNKASTLKADAEEYVALVVYMPETVGNEANYKTGTAVPRIDLGINLVATQLTYEGDSYGSDYDADAGYAVEVGDADALAAALLSGGYIRLVNDITGTFYVPADVAVTLDLNGKTLTAGADGYALRNQDGGSLTINDESGNGTVVGVVFNKLGTTVINGGTYNPVSSSANYVILNNAGDLVINDATINGGAYYAVFSYNSGSNIVINNANVNATFGCVNAYGENSTAVINGGTYKMSGQVNKSSHIAYFATGVKATINGGTFEKVEGVDVSGTGGGGICVDDGADLAITGGSFAGEYADVYSWDSTGKATIAISGGTFAYDPSAYVSAGLDVVANSDGTWSVVPHVSGNETDIAALLTSNYENIAVKLDGDVALPITSLGAQTPGSGEYKLGGADTESIVIDLGGNTLDITTTYWSAIGAVNPDATITIKNGTLTSTGNSANTWNAWNVRLCNCNYVLEDVTFGKAVALDNAGKSTVMNNVTINETSGDKYALWITAEGQDVTIDGLTVNCPAGRAIKIDDQYVDAAALVELDVANASFNTAKKSAIIVKSPAGANITLENVDLSGVAADPIHAVWIDEDAAAYADLVTVTGGKKIIEGTVTFIGDAAALAALGGTQISGNYALTADIDMTGVDMESMILSAGADVNFAGNGFTISNLTLGVAGYNGFTGAGAEVAGLFDTTGTAVSLFVSDLTVEDATVACDGYAAVITGYNSNGGTTVTLNNVDVKGATVTSDTVAAFVGYTTGKVTLIGCDVEDLALTGEAGRPEKVGAFIGTANTATCVVTTENCTNNTTYNNFGRVIGGATAN